MNKSKVSLIGLLSLITFVVAVVVTVLDATVMDTRSVNPVLLGLGVLLLGLGVIFLTFAFVGKKGGLNLAGSILLALGVLYFCADFIEPINWVILFVVPIGVCVFFVGLSFVLSYKGTTIEFDNDNPDYKTYKQRQEDNSADNG